MFAADDVDLAGVARRTEIKRLAVCFSDMTGLPDAGSAPPPARSLPESPSRHKRTLDVVFRSQTTVPGIGKRACSPTSLAMMLDYRGVVLPTKHVAAVAYDDAHDIYGNWPRSVQAAYTLGVPGYLTRFSDWHEVEESIANDQPLIISVRVAEGQLQGAPYSSTAGHLLVLRGFAEDGSVEVNDPAAPDAAKGQVRYSRADLETVWLDRGGTAYVLLPPGTDDAL